MAKPTPKIEHLRKYTAKRGARKGERHPTLCVGLKFFFRDKKQQLEFFTAAGHAFPEASREMYSED